MEDHKRSNFQMSNPGETFPQVNALCEEDARRLRARIAQHLRCDETDGLTLVRTLAGRSVLVDGVNAESEEFDLRAVLWRLRIAPNPTVYLNWYHFDRIDSMAIEDLARYFGDLWYPSLDDLDVFDETCDWVVSVGHSGDVRVARLGVRRTIGA